MWAALWVSGLVWVFSIYRPRPPSFCGLARSDLRPGPRHQPAAERAVNNIPWEILTPVSPCHIWNCRYFQRKSWKKYWIAMSMDRSDWEIFVGMTLNILWEKLKWPSHIPGWGQMWYFVFPKRCSYSHKNILWPKILSLTAAVYWMNCKL